MRTEAQQIAEQIKVLVDQLVGMSTAQPPSQKVSKTRKAASEKKGAAGAISILTEEGFFDKPQDLSAVIGRLQQIGRYYPKGTIAMNLLNLTKRRIFHRIKDNKTKQWQYVLRR